MMQIWLVCGGRRFDDTEMFQNAMHHLVMNRGMPTCIVHGNAYGADTMADHWAHKRNLPVRRFDAEWTRFGKAAGPLRNQEMLEEMKPDLVVAFPGGPGTADMVRRGKAAGIPTVEVNRRSSPEGGEWIAPLRLLLAPAGVTWSIA